MVAKNEDFIVGNIFKYIYLTSLSLGIFGIYKTLNEVSEDLSSLESLQELAIGVPIYATIAGASILNILVAKEMVDNSGLTIKSWLKGYRACYECDEVSHNKDMVIAYSRGGGEWYHKECAREEYDDDSSSSNIETLVNESE